MPVPVGHTMLAITTEQHLIGKRLEKVPSHVMLLPWTRLTDKRRSFMKAVGSICRGSQMGPLITGDLIEAGDRGAEIGARAVSGEGLIVLHKKLFAAAVELGLELSNPEWLGEGYQPHISGNLTVDQITTSTVTVIDNHKDEARGRGIKIVTQQFKLGSG